MQKFQEWYKGQVLQQYVRRSAHITRHHQSVVDTHLSKFYLCCRPVSVGKLSNISLFQRSNNVPQLFPLLWVEHPHLRSQSSILPASLCFLSGGGVSGLYPTRKALYLSVSRRYASMAGGCLDSIVWRLPTGHPSFPLDFAALNRQQSQQCS